MGRSRTADGPPTEAQQLRAVLQLRDQYLEGLAALMLTPGLDPKDRQQRADLLIGDMREQIRRLAPGLCDVRPRIIDPDAC
jgi:hypothetical protein